MNSRAKSVICFVADVVIRYAEKTKDALSTPIPVDTTFADEEEPITVPDHRNPGFGVNPITPEAAAMRADLEPRKASQSPSSTSPLSGSIADRINNARGFSDE